MRPTPYVSLNATAGLHETGTAHVCCSAAEGVVETGTARVSCGVYKYIRGTIRNQIGLSKLA